MRRRTTTTDVTKPKVDLLGMVRFTQGGEPDSSVRSHTTGINGRTSS
jgi:hypothetical protein